MEPSEPFTLAGSVRPQTFGRERADRIQQPVVEPLWLGLWVIVAASADAVTILDDGTPIDDQVRIASPSRDELQEVMRLLQEQDFGVALQFGNYRG